MPGVLHVALGDIAGLLGVAVGQRRHQRAYRDGEQKGLGAVGVNGVLVDAAHVKMAQATLARAALIKDGR
jgi:hypothetical protein